VSKSTLSRHCLLEAASVLLWPPLVLQLPLVVCPSVCSTSSVSRLLVRVSISVTFSFIVFLHKTAFGRLRLRPIVGPSNQTKCNGSIRPIPPSSSSPFRSQRPEAACSLYLQTWPWARPRLYHRGHREWCVRSRHAMDAAHFFFFQNDAC
jgi:hypothetical protein